MRLKDGIRHNITFYKWAKLVVLSLIFLGFVILIHEQINYAKLVKNSERSAQLAAELRQSSNDLARLVRTYLITGNSLYKEQFHAVVEIRDGLRPRPENYTLAYWDVRGLDGELSPQSEVQGDAVALIDLMKEAGLTAQEQSNLQRSKAISDTLVMIENKAMTLVEEDTPTDPEKLKLALNLLADENFMRSKAEIMRLIVDTESMIIARKQAALESANQRLIGTTVFLLVNGLVLVLLIIKTGQHINTVIGGPVEDLQGIIQELSKGDFANPIEVGNAPPNSVIGWLAAMQSKLALLNLGYFKAIVESSDDAIVSKTPQGIVTSWNAGAEKIFGYRAEEIIGKPMTTIIPPERLHEEPEILAKIAQGEKVAHFITQRQHKDGHLIDISVTISPVYNQQGQLIGASKIAKDISDRVAAEAEIKRLAFYDSLTGVANRRMLYDKLRKMHRAAVRDNKYLMVVFIDLDNFKPLNDSKGHEAGDILLKEVAGRLVSCVRHSDTVARFGGDEFVVLLQGPARTTPPSIRWAEDVILRIQETLSSPYTIAGSSHVCTPSIGITQLNDNFTRAEDLLKQADQAMYSAKKMGKNTLKVFSA